MHKISVSCSVIFLHREI